MLGGDGRILAGFFVKLYILLINVIINVKNGGAYMGLYMLKNTWKDIEDGIVEKVKSDSIDYECYFESWLENSPSLLFDDEDDGNTVLWIGRQVTASVGDVGKFPDLIGIDASGDLVIVELKKGKTPREVIAQILEYAAWGSQLDYNDLDDLARSYYSNDKNNSGKSLKEIFQEIFNIEDDVIKEIDFNRRQKLYIVAEEVSPVVRQVSEYLKNTYKININHLEYQVFKTKDDEYLLSVEKTLGFDMNRNNNIKSGINISSTGWNGNEKVKDIIYREVIAFTNGNKAETFTPKDIIKSLIERYPNVNKSTVRCQLIQDCVNHTSRKHYPSGQQDYYFLVDNGSYRLYDSDKDGKWDWEGKPIMKI